MFSMTYAGVIELAGMMDSKCTACPNVLIGATLDVSRSLTIE